MFENLGSETPKTLFSQDTWLGKNENDIIMNLFFMSVISFLFIHATIIIFPIVSDKLYVDILKKKLNKMNKLSKSIFNFELKKNLKEMYKDADSEKIKEDRDNRNRDMIISKIAYFRYITYILLTLSLGIIITKWIKHNDGSSFFNGCMLNRVHFGIVLAMILSFTTEIAIYFLVFSQYVYMPDIKMYSIILDQLLKLFNNIKL